MRRRFCGGTSHISDMLENGIWVITLYEGIIKGDRYDNRFITPGMICVIEDNIRFCYREFNVQDYTPIKWIEGVSRIPDIPYVGDKDLARLDYDGKGNSRRIMELYGDYNTAAKNLYDTQQWSYENRTIHPYLMSCGELDLVIRWQNDIAHVENTAWWYNGISRITLSTKEIWTSTLCDSVTAYLLYNKQYISISNINNERYCYPIYDVDESIYLIYGDDNPPIIG